MKTSSKLYSALVIIVISASLVYFFTKQEIPQLNNLKPLSQKKIDSPEFGNVKVIIYKDDSSLTVHFLSPENNKLLAKRTIDFNENYREGLSQIEFFAFDINDDKKDDLIILHTYPIAAGPRAGMEVMDYFAYINQNERYIPFNKNTAAQKYIIEHEIYDSINKIKRLYSNLYKGKNTNSPVGLMIPDNKKRALNLLENENLILSFKRKKSKKRLTIAIDKAQNYLVYRYGTAGKVELTFKMNRNEKPVRFEYIEENNYGYSRYEIRNLVFSINDYQYTIYDNNIEAHKTAADGVGIKIKNTKSGKTITLNGDKNSKQGKLDFLKTINWIKLTTISGKDYADE